MNALRAGLGVGLCLLAGCASEQWTYSRPGLTPARLDVDLDVCRRQAHRPQWFALTRSGRVDQDALNQCMERKGYTVRREP
jgi:hypothetical protein